MNKKFSAIVVQMLQAERIKSGKSQNELATAAGFPSGSFAHMEALRREIRLYEFYILCKELNLDPARVLSTGFKRMNSRSVNNNSVKFPSRLEKRLDSALKETISIVGTIHGSKLITKRLNAIVKNKSKQRIP